MINNYNVSCNNCGGRGHLLYQCKLPIISYGIILTNRLTNKYLMIRRKNSFGYIDFMRGKYNINNKEQIQNLIDEMSNEEKDDLLNYSFLQLWKNMWENIKYKFEENIAEKKFNSLKYGITLDSSVISLKSLIENTKTQWQGPEWEFPKGRKNYQEKLLECALREFEEETGYLKSDLKIVDNILPFEEIFIGSNNKSYKHKYYLGILIKNVNDETNFQKSEVSKVEWKSFEDCLESMRPYNHDKKKILSNVHELLLNYDLIY